jgi:DNA polymerase-3 subunit beta
VKFRCERDVLAEALTTAGRAVSARSAARPALSGLRFSLEGDHLQITGSDLDITIAVDVVVAGDQDGHAVIPARLATDIVKSFEPGAVTLEVDGANAQIASGRSQFSVHAIPPEEFPQVAPAGGESIKLDPADFADGLRQVVPAASSDDSRPILTGVQLSGENGGLRMVATDSYRLAVRDLPNTMALDDGRTVLVPSRALQEVTRALAHADELHLDLGERDASFVVGAVRLTTRLIDGDVPNYRTLIPESQPNRLTVSRTGFIDALRRVKLMAREATPVRLTMHPNSVELMAITQDVGQASEELDASYEGAEFTVAFNPDYLLAGLEVTPGDEVTLETTDPGRQAVMRSLEHPDFLYLLMPVRVS